MSRFSFPWSLMAVSALAFMPVAQSVAADSNDSNGAWFVPKASQPAAPAAAPHHHAAPAAAPAPAAMPDMGGVDEGDGAAEGEGQQVPPVLPLPPVPASPVVPKENAPPAVVMGLISVQGVMQLSTAAQEMQQVLGERRDRLARVVQKEEAAWREEQQKLQVQARTLTSDQLQLRVRHLQERRARDQRDFSNQARIIQEAYQVAFHQIERVLEQRDGIIARVAGAHGMNLVLHAEQAVLHVDGQDITEEVADLLNKVLPHVFIPGDGVDPEALAKSGKMPTTADEERLMNQATTQPAEAPAAQPQPQDSVLRRQQ
ncbi:OmpH family outer membrane protein [Bombella sp. TMW 2.2559]|uniref:OmpH family outer membrane protein n=1 Tax=Bombella dulcis TaxID=2967339 RepID=A0ABT3WCJ7_9PROT|nr:OmpH family outer membrane protein [Bombella dulcis]MCX5615497.1 OmpH family outer membrane protein [Bombella dulcis]